jgi:hypothetical protein
MAVNKGPLFTIDATESFLAGQAQIIGPLDNNYQLVAAAFMGDTATVPVVAAGSYNTSTGVFTAVTTLINGLDGAASSLGATTTAATGVGTAVTTFAASTPIAAGQYLRITSGTNTLARYRLEMKTLAAASTFTVATTPA